MTPMITPAQPLPTPGQPLSTPSYQPTPRTSWPVATPGRVPVTPGRVPVTPGRVPVTPGAYTPSQVAMTPGARPSVAIQRHMLRPATSNTDWAKAAEMWAKRKHDSPRRIPTPRDSPAIRPSPSPLYRPSPSPLYRPSPSLSFDDDDDENAGDATPLIDERWGNRGLNNLDITEVKRWIAIGEPLQNLKSALHNLFLVIISAAYHYWCQYRLSECYIWMETSLKMHTDEIGLNSITCNRWPCLFLKIWVTNIRVVYKILYIHVYMHM